MRATVFDFPRPKPCRERFAISYDHLQLATESTAVGEPDGSKMYLRPNSSTANPNPMHCTDLAFGTPAHSNTLLTRRTVMD